MIGELWLPRDCVVLKQREKKAGWQMEKCYSIVLLKGVLLSLIEFIRQLDCDFIQNGYTKNNYCDMIIIYVL